MHQRIERELRSALSEFEHEGRRIRDRLEGVGGRSMALEAQLEQIKKNVARIRRELAETVNKTKKMRDRRP